MGFAEERRLIVAVVRLSAIVDDDGCRLVLQESHREAGDDQLAAAQLCRRPIKATDTYIAFETYEVGALEARAGIPVVHLRIDRPAIPDEVVNYRIFGPVGDGSKVIHGYGRYDNNHDDGGDQFD